MTVLNSIEQVNNIDLFDAAEPFGMLPLIEHRLSMLDVPNPDRVLASLHEAVTKGHCELRTTDTPYFGVAEQDLVNIQNALKDETWVSMSDDAKLQFINGQLNELSHPYQTIRTVPSDITSKDTLARLEDEGLVIFSTPEQLFLPLADRDFKINLYTEILAATHMGGPGTELDLKEVISRAKSTFAEKHQDNEIVKMFTQEALDLIPEVMKAHPLEIIGLSPEYQSDYDIGIEIYEPRVMINDKPNLYHHDIGDTAATPSAIAQAMEFDVSVYASDPKVAFIKPNKDALGAIAVLALKRQGILFNEGMVKAIDLADRYGPIAYRIDHELEQYRERLVLLDNISAARDISTAEKVSLIKAVLTDTYPLDRAKIATHRRAEAYASALANTETTILLENKLCYVKSNERFGPEIGYGTGCPIVISHNDSFPKRKPVTIEGSKFVLETPYDTVHKFSISLIDEHVQFDMEELKKRLNQKERYKALEAGEPTEKIGTWGGRSGFVGSPEGRNTYLSVDDIQSEVIKVIEETQEKTRSAEKPAIPDIYDYILLNARDAGLEDLIKGKKLLGIEVTDPTLAKMCTEGNIDPQHTVGSHRLGANVAAIEVCADYPLPDDDVTLATIRPDLDSLGSISVFNLRAWLLAAYDVAKIEDALPESGVRAEELLTRVAAIAKADQHGRGTWPGVRPLPSIGDTPDIQSYSGVPAGLARLLYNHKTPLNERIHLMKDWLLQGACEGLEEANRRVQEEYDLSVKETQILNTDDSRLVVVVSNHRSAFSLGYTQAPVVLAYTDKFRFPSGEIGRKYTLAQYDKGHIDLVHFLEELRKLDPRAGGSDVIVGSNQFEPSNIQPEQWTALALKHLL